VKEPSGPSDPSGFGDDVTVVPLTFDAVLGLAMQLLGTTDGVYYAPSIPHRKEKNVRGVHAAWLPPDEPLVALLDDTLFGAGDDGYAITPLRLVWRNYTEEPHHLAWQQVMSVDEDPLTVNGLQVKTTSGKDSVLDASVALFRSRAASSRAMFGGGMPFGEGPAQRGCMRCGAPPAGPGPFCTQCGAPR